MDYKLLIKEKDGKLIYTGFHMIAYVPEYYFENGMAEEVGDLTTIFGIFDTKHFISENDTKGTGLIPFEFPSFFYTSPDEVTREELTLYNTPEKFRLFHYYNGGVVFNNTHIIQDINNVGKFITLLNEGKLTTDYARMASLFVYNKDINKQNLNVPAFMEEAVISEVYRDANNLSVPARFVAKVEGKNNIVGLNIRNKTGQTSTFSGLTFEDINSMMVIADNRSSKGVKDAPSVIENIIKGD
jgi:hypothetical protein